MSTSYPAAQNMIAALGLQSLPEKRRIELLNTAVELVEKRIFLRLIEGLSDVDAAEAEKLADRPQELMAFLTSHGPSMDMLLEEEIGKVREELRSIAEGIDGV